MKPLKLKKIKISKIGNPHILFGGAQQAAQAANSIYYPVTYTLDSKFDDTCQSHTNSGGTLGRTGAAAEPLNNGIQN